ncbi:MAG: potassium-transporting ATPase subunit KdpA, partial [Dictyoglomus sp.]
MTLVDLIYFSVFILLLTVTTPIIGTYMTKIFTVEMLPGERLIYKFLGVDPKKEMKWGQYAFNLIVFNVLGLLVLFLILIFQGYLPLNPQGYKGFSWDLALNTAVSFTTNTNWQAYVGENRISYFSQMLGLTVQNFLSAGTGIVVFVALA